MAEPRIESVLINSVEKSYELTLEGRIYADVAPRLQEELERIDEAGLKYLVVNAEGLEQIDSSGLNVFVHQLKRLRPQGGRIVFYGLNVNIARVFEITKLSKVMGIEGSREAALRSLA